MKIVKSQPLILNDLLLLTLIILIISPIPIISGISTLSLSLILIVFLSLFNGYLNRFYLNKNILIFAFIYFSLVVFSTGIILEDVNYRLMYLSTMMIILNLSFIKLKVFNTKVLVLSVILFAFLVSLNADILLTSILNQDTRLDVLNWQKESQFIYGINKFLLGIYVFSILFCISDIKIIYKYAIILLYLSFSIFLGSRSHSLLSIILLLINVIYLNRPNIRGNHIQLLGGLTASIIVFIIIGYFFDYGLIYERSNNFIFNFSNDKRGIILEKFATCLSSHAQLIGHDVLTCTQSLTYDLDNSFAFVLASSGYIAFICFILLLMWSYVLLRKAGLNKVWIIYILMSLFILLNVDIIVYRPIILLPLFIYIIRMGISHNAKARHHAYFFPLKPMEKYL